MNNFITENEYRTLLIRVDEIIDAPEGTPEYEELEELAQLISDYEDIRYPIGPAKQEEIDKLLGSAAPIEIRNLEPVITKNA